MELNKYIEHTNLKADATEEDIKKLCEEVVEYSFASICVNPHFVPFVKEILNGQNIEIATVVGYPLGANTIESKVYEAIDDVENGATEINMVINIGAIKDKDFDYVKNEIEEIRDAIDGKTLKIIIDTCYLTLDELKKVIEICNETYVNFIEISIDSKVLNNIEEYKNELLEIKISNVKDYHEAIELIEMGVSRIGTNYGIEIMNHKCEEE